MKAEEKIANEYLVDREGPNVVHEPNGKHTFPDFLVNGKIAVEVRRLNQNEVTESGYSSLEGTRIRLKDTMRKFLASFGPSQSGISWSVSYRFQRPLPSQKQRFSVLGRYLTAFRDDPQGGPTFFAIDKNFVITLSRIGAHSTFFVLGPPVDRDATYWELPELEKNLRICIAEKTRKRDQCPHCYPESWLILVDRIALGVKDCDRERYREYLKFDHDWDKIILLSPDDAGRAFELL